MTHYVIVRGDLPVGVAAAQMVHAAGESSPGNLPPNTYAIVLAAKDEESLLGLEYTLIENDIPHVAIRETDSPWNGALMAIGLVPALRQKYKPYLSSFPLYGSVAQMQSAGSSQEAGLTIKPS